MSFFEMPLLPAHANHWRLNLARAIRGGMPLSSLKWTGDEQMVLILWLARPLFPADFAVVAGASEVREAR